jgi:hypothetical protein
LGHRHRSGGATQDRDDEHDHGDAATAAAPDSTTLGPDVVPVYLLVLFLRFLAPPIGIVIAILRFFPTPLRLFVLVERLGAHRSALVPATATPPVPDRNDVALS